METSDIILEELRALRSDYNDHARATGERLAKLDEQMHDLCGNGQPGRISKLESAVQRLQAWRWYLVGAGAGVSLLLTGAAWLLHFVVH
jgi:hypothetical protein